MNLHYECPECGATAEVSEEEIKKVNYRYHIVCDNCDIEMKLKNTSEIVRLDIEKQVEQYVTLWFRELGIEYTIEMIERHQNIAVKRLYLTELKRRGLMK